MKLLRLAFRSLWRNKRRSLLSTATVGFGTLAVLVAGGFMEYTFFGLRETTIRTDLGHIQVEHPRYADTGSQEPLAYGLEGVGEVVRTIENHSAVRYTMARLEMQGLITVGDRSEVFVGRGVEAEKEEPFAAGFAPVTVGHGLVEGSGREDQDEIVLAEGLARKLGAKVGDWVTVLVTTAQGGLNGMDLKVVGFINHFIPEYDERFVMLPLITAQGLLRTDKVSRLVTVLRDTDMTDATVAELQAELPQLTVVPWYERATYYRSVVQLYHTIFGFLGSIVVVVVILTSFNTLVMTIMERIPEVGTLMAVGVPRAKVMWTFLLEGGLIGAFGAVAGALLTIAVMFLINAADIQMPPPPGGTREYLFRLQWVGSHFAVVPLAMILACMAATYLPARHASRLNISWALRHR